MKVKNSPKMRNLEVCRLPDPQIPAAFANHCPPIAESQAELAVSEPCRFLQNLRIE
jgi:hypothetical protein